MSNTLKWVLGTVGVLVIGAALVWGGIGIGWTMALRQTGAAGYPGMMGPGMMGAPFGQTGEGGTVYGPGMMGGFYGQPESGTLPYGMMGGMMGSGMMSGYGGLADAEPLSIEDARAAIEDYLARVGNDDLALHEVMIFDNHAYGLIVEESTGVGAMEVLVDPVTEAVYPEHGPNMMWNLKYSPMGASGGYGMMGGMMGRGSGWQSSAEVSAEMPVAAEQAAEFAQRYLDAYLPGTRADEHADAFYGYYTLHILRDGEVVGMLSVNGYTGQVFPHTWHGDFVEMTEE